MKIVHNFAKIIHRDIKPDNLLIDQNDILKLADFGVAHIMEDENQDEIQGELGTKQFLSPEYVQGKKVQGKAADIWATGVTFYLIAFGYPPFFAKQWDDLKNLIVNQQVEFPEGTDEQLQDFFRGCLEKDVKKRSSLEELMEHPFITLNGQDPLPIEWEEDNQGIILSENEIRGALTKVRIRGTVRVSAKLKIHLNQSRQRIKSRTMMQQQQDQVIK